jgi:hypothetical protein
LVSGAPPLPVRIPPSQTAVAYASVSVKTSTGQDGGQETTEDRSEDRPADKPVTAQAIERQLLQYFHDHYKYATVKAAVAVFKLHHPNHKW